MGVRAIPRHLLIHTIEYSEFEGNDGWNDTFAPYYDINRVRVVPVSRLKRSSNSEGEEVSHVVIVDKVNSSAFPDFKIKSKIKFQGIEREVVDVKAHYAFGSEPHNYEVELR